MRVCSRSTTSGCRMPLSSNRLRRLAVECQVYAHARVSAEEAERKPDTLDDAELVRRTAAEFVALRGADAPRHLRDFAEVASGMGDPLSQEAWLDLAAAAETLIANFNALSKGEAP